MARVAYRTELVDAGELDLVSRDQLRKARRRLEEAPETGKPLKRSLVGYRSIRVGGSENRLVYQYHREIDLVEVVAIERRRDDEAYDVASARAEND